MICSNHKVDETKSFFLQRLVAYCSGNTTKNEMIERDNTTKTNSQILRLNQKLMR